MAQVATQQNKLPSVKDFFEKPAVKQKIQELLNKNAAAFSTSVLQIVNSNSLLKDADPMTIFNAACMAATLNLPLQNGLGFAYIVPYKNNKTKKYEAQFQIGYKGLIQLAQRSGQFKRLVAVPVYKEQLVAEDPINGYEFDWSKKPESGEVPIGYYAYFKLLNEFTAEIYMTTEEVNEHAKRYSQTYRTYLQKKEQGQWATSVWADNFDAMALKTVMKLLLSKQAPLSVEMQKAVLADQAVVKDVEKGEFNYADNANIQDAEFTDLKVSGEQFEQCKQNIINGETTLQELCDAGFDFSSAQYDELEQIENERNGNVQS
ncbi:recombinase RecT [Pasteurella multocida]|uniref:recombinase RecT n=1 Tax=Pasteurella multocida TaxID=747 RepID=UPI00064C6D49|nr:recombinase RecT [Pasteurella multocida]KLT48595.1 recombinase [Pasteurella multocida subsp. multocida]KLT52911.1 recombinase [Pasteurella multocida subsp. multocida]KLT58274.1 recombinase [Pasteurella multocida subsp. multocida]KLT62914.1 recombinase [Pasteurella multocida subsp. multocida]KLU28292.1 recombinase [Pasteurella multocida subsp. multocida]